MLNFYDLFEKGCYQEIIQSSELKYFAAAKDPMLANLIAASYFKLGHYSESLSLLKEVESCFSADPSYLSLYGACLRRCGNLEAARSQLEQALKIEPENPSIRNNFANLLIDLNDYQRSESILSELLRDNPDYYDAQINMKRLKEKQRIQQLQSSGTSFIHSPAWCLADPLMLAFSEEEVQRTCPNPSQSDQKNQALKGNLPSINDQQVATDQLDLAYQAVQEGRHEFALQLCSNVHKSMPTSAALFECVSDAYIALQRFTDAEACLLHSIQLGGKSFKLYANLISLLCIRSDFSLAQHYLELASLLDNANPLLAKLSTQIAKGRENNKSSMIRFDCAWSRPDLKLKND